VLTATAKDKLPDDTPADDEIEDLWNLCETPDNIREHCRAVCNEAISIREQLAESGITLSSEQLRAAALLHDLLRHMGRNHAENAAVLIRERGYIRTARIVETHHDCDINAPLNEEQILCIADKRFYGTERITIEERFTQSWEKCDTEESKRAHKARLHTALFIEEKIRLCSGLI
jgi:HD superfamily phosphodiesterase